jgi:hypothetical protein
MFPKDMRIYGDTKSQRDEHLQLRLFIYYNTEQDTSSLTSKSTPCQCETSVQHASCFMWQAVNDHTIRPEVVLGMKNEIRKRNGIFRISAGNDFVMWYYSCCRCRSRWPHGLRRRSWPLGYWDHGFKSHLRHGRSSLCFCVLLSCVGRGLCDGLITRPKESYQVSLQDYETRCDATKVLTRTVELLTMIMTVVFRVDAVRLCLWTAATNVPTVHPPGDMSVRPWWNDNDREEPNNSERNLS